jgi:hypothetical protein
MSLFFAVMLLSRPEEGRLSRCSTGAASRWRRRQSAGNDPVLCPPDHQGAHLVDELHIRLAARHGVQGYVIAGDHNERDQQEIADEQP